MTRLRQEIFLVSKEIGRGEGCQNLSALSIVLQGAWGQGNGMTPQILRSSSLVV